MPYTLQTFKEFGLFSLGHDIFGKYFNNYIRVNPANIIKVKDYMHSG